MVSLRDVTQDFFFFTCLELFRCSIRQTWDTFRISTIIMDFDVITRDMILQNFCMTYVESHKGVGSTAICARILIHLNASSTIPLHKIDKSHTHKKSNPEFFATTQTSHVSCYRFSISSPRTPCLIARFSFDMLSL